MNDLLRTLFGVKAFSPGDPGVRFEFGTGIPLWSWTLIIPFLLLIAAYGYWRLEGNRSARFALGTLRALTLCALALLLAGPQLVRQEERVEKDWAVMAIDRSASMGIRDVVTPQGQNSREDELHDSLANSKATLASLAQDRNVLWLGFSSAVADLPYSPNAPTPLTLNTPSGSRTDINMVLEQALRRTAARPAAGIVLMSDGRAAAAIDPNLIKRLQAERIPVFVVPLGSPQSIGDVAIRRVDAPTQAFTGDIVPVTVELDQLDTDPSKPIRGHIELRDIQTDKVLDQRDLATVDKDHRITLTTRPDATGATHWRVQLKLDQPDLSTQNDQALVDLDLSDRPIRVVYFDGSPRWEYRYLKNLLVREESIKSSAMLLAPDRRFIQEGSDPLLHIPTKQEDWNEFDVVILGDVRPEIFSEDQQKQLRDLVAQRGAGLLMMAGTTSMPQRWRSTVLDPLIPFSAAGAESGSSGSTRVWNESVTMRREPAAERLGILQLSDTGTDWPVPITDPGSGWSLLRWMQKIDPTSLKPTAEVLASALPGTAPESSSGTPAVVTMRFGAGRVAYVATDETWRWRYGRGESYQERFWLPLIRLMARESLGRTGKPALLDAMPHVVQVEQPVRITLRLLDQSLQDASGTAVAARITTVGSRDARPTAIELSRERAVENGAAAPALYSTTWIPSTPGIYTVQTATPALDSLGLTTTIEVTSSDDEMRRPQTDHPLLESLAKATGGTVIKPAELARISELLPNRKLRVLGPSEVQTLWDKPIALTTLLALLVLEWIGRRLLKFV